MPQNTSLDEFLNSRKAFVKSGDVLVKAFKAPASWNPEARSAKFVMSTEAPDRDRDIIMQAGLDITEFMKNPQGLMFHNSRSWPIGLWSDVQKVAGRPKRTEGVLTLLPEGTEPDADRAAAHVAAGTIKTVSIGFIPKTVKRREKEEDANEWSWPGYEILESELVECSLVPIPAQPGAIAKDAGGDEVLARDIIEEILDTWVRLPSGVTVSRKTYEDALAAMAPAKSTVVVPPVPKDPVVPPAPVVVVTTEDPEVKSVDDLVAQIESDLADRIAAQKPEAKTGFRKTLTDAFNALFAKSVPTPPLPPEALGTTAVDDKTKAAALAGAALIDARVKSFV